MGSGENKKNRKQSKAEAEGSAREEQELKEAPAADEDGAIAEPRKKKKRRSADAEGEAEADGDERGQGGEGTDNKKKDAGDSEAAVFASPAIASEEERRLAQREIQQLVVRLRKEGKSEAEIARAKQELKAKFGQLRKPDNAREKKNKAWFEKLSQNKAERTEEEWKKVEEERKEKLQRKHDLVVIPVLWRGRHDSEEVLKAAEIVKACLAQQGVDVWVDSRRHYTPGQKFAHWEHRGVMLRVEVGPEDLQQGVCRVCLAKEPGQYKSVERKRVRLPPKGARKLLLMLKEWGLSKIEVKQRPGEDEADEDEEGGSDDQAEAGKSSSKGGGEEAVDDDVGGNWAPRMSASQKEKQKASGSKKRKGRKRLRRRRTRSGLRGREGAGAY